MKRFIAMWVIIGLLIIFNPKYPLTPYYYKVRIFNKHKIIKFHIYRIYLKNPSISMSKLEITVNFLSYKVFEKDGELIVK